MRLFLSIILSLIFIGARPCTSMIVSAERSATGRPLLWKHRDTDADNNFLAKVEATDSTFSYIGLFNAGDSLLAEAWMGMNERGFAIMNTASYNVAPHESPLEDREAVIMSEALKYCKSVDDFAMLLDALPKPLGVQANFGVIDAYGGASYFETSDREWTMFNVADSDDGYLIRTNFSVSGDSLGGRGYIRYETAHKLASDNKESLTPQLLTEFFSRQFYHSLIGRDFSGDSIFIDADFIPRPISQCSLVVEGVNEGDDTSEIRMWGCVGYPPCAVSEWITLESIPEGFGPNENWRSTSCDEANALRRSTLPLSTPEGNSYIDMKRLKPIIERCVKRP